MFGLPYAGRMPDFAGMPPRGGYAGRGGGHRSVDPDVLEGRMLREEQEIAFQESLEVRWVCERPSAWQPRRHTCSEVAMFSSYKCFCTGGRIAILSVRDETVRRQLSVFNPKVG
jgi:hypothetical protein